MKRSSKRFRGMRLEGEKLSRAEIKRRKECLRIERLLAVKEGRKRKLAIRGEEPMADVHARRKKVGLERTCMGKSSKKCGKCGEKSRLMRYKGAFGKKHLLCPVCGWSDRVVERWGVV